MMCPSNLADVAQAVCASRGYVLSGRVGEGSSKETFRVTSEDGNSLALKVLRERNSPQRLQREIDAMVRCNHPNIGALTSVDTMDLFGKTYLYMIEEFLEGGTLSDMVSDRTLVHEELVDLGRQLVSAISYLASLNLVHRDIKPDNIMFRRDGKTPVIVDFGVVRNLSQSTLTQTWLQMGPGTPYFAAPEQLLNQKELIDWRTDQFSLGVLLITSGLGYHPYSELGDTPDEVVERVSQRRGPSKRTLDACGQLRLPVLTQMVAPWPVERYRTPRNLAEAWND